MVKWSRRTRRASPPPSPQSAERPGVEALRDPPGDESYPIIGISWLVLRRHYDDPAKLPALIDLMEYALGPGQQDVAALGYMPYSAEGIAYVQDLLDGLKQYDETNASSRGVAPSHDR